MITAESATATAPAARTPDAASDATAVVVDATGVDDFVATLPREAMPARGLAREFDSMEATLHLAVRTGAINAPDEFAQTFALPRAAVDASLQRFAVEPRRRSGGSAEPTPAAWSRRDRGLFLGALIGATALGALIVLV
jgi:hypothetical protein